MPPNKVFDLFIGFFRASPASAGIDEISEIKVMQQELPCSLGFECATVAESERQKAERRLRYIQKMEVIGRYAGGIVHDLNNILTVIVGNSQLLLDHPEVKTSAGHRVQHILDAGLRAANLTGQLLAFSRKQSIRLEPLDLNEMITKNSHMIRFLVGNGIQLNTCLAADLRHVNADRGQMEQVLINLCVNARDAMPLGGTIRIESQNVDAAEERFPSCPVQAKPGRYVRFSVSDTGNGMDPMTLKRIFEPFYTTKEAGKGMGLGLATVQSIVKHACGQVCAQSELGRGSVFSVYLPALPESAGLQRDELLLGKMWGTETILLVAAESSLRASLREILQSLGYTVLEAQDAELAAQITNRHKDVALALIDIDLPGVSGLTLTAKLRKLRPELRVLQLTAPPCGFVNHGLTEEGNDFLQKPVAPQALAQKLRQLLCDLT